MHHSNSVLFQLLICYSWLSFTASSVLPIDALLKWELLTNVCCTVTLYLTIHIAWKICGIAGYWGISRLINDFFCAVPLRGVYLIDRTIQLNVPVAMRKEEQRNEEGSYCVFKAARFVSKGEGWRLNTSVRATEKGKYLKVRLPVHFSEKCVSCRI